MRPSSIAEQRCDDVVPVALPPAQQEHGHDSAKFPALFREDDAVLSGVQVHDGTDLSPAPVQESFMSGIADEANLRARRFVRPPDLLARRVTKLSICAAT